MTDFKVIATALFMELKVPIINTYARSHGIKIGKNKRATITNILDKCDRFKISINAFPCGDIEGSICYTPKEEVD